VAPGNDPYRMYLVVRKGAVESLARAGELAGAAAVGCLRRFGAPAEWRSRPGKVCLRARSESHWDAVLEEPHFCAGDGVLALPPQRPSERPQILDKLQAMATELAPPASGSPAPGMNYVLNPDAAMSSGKTLAQIAHAAVMAADVRPAWAALGCPASVVAPSASSFASLAASSSCVTRVEDAGLTEVPPGTVTVLAVELSPAG
jgi:hypothetical protein